MQGTDNANLEQLPAAIREQFFAVTAGDFDRAAATLHPDATLKMHGKSYKPGFLRLALVSGPYLAEMRKAFDTLAREPGDRILVRFDEIEPLDPDRFFIVGVLGTLDDRGGASGARFGWILTMRDDLVWRAEMFDDIAAAGDAASPAPEV